MGAQWKEPDEIVTCFLSRVFGLLNVDPDDPSFGYVSIKAKKNQCRDASPIRIPFEFDQYNYGRIEYINIMSVCMSLLDKYDYFKKTGKEGIMQNYLTKGQMAKIILKKSPK